MNGVLRTFLLVLLIMAAPMLARADGEPMRLPVDETRLAVVAASGERRAVFDVEIARTPDAHARGLMHRTDLPDDRAMLFVFGQERVRAFWMKDTPLPLDIIYTDASGRIVSIAASTMPFSTRPIPSGAPAQFVLEVHAGTVDKTGIARGDRLRHPAIDR